MGEKFLQKGAKATQLAGISMKGVHCGLGAGLGNGLANAGSAVSSTVPWLFASVVYTAQTGYNYRKYKRGEITKKDFQRSAKIGAVGVGAGILGASGGGAVGFLLGTLILPGIGSGIGTIVGSIAGGISGKKLSTKVYEKIEEKIF
jgi:hypothetical protein